MRTRQYFDSSGISLTSFHCSSSHLTQQSICCDKALDPGTRHSLCHTSCFSCPPDHQIGEAWAVHNCRKQVGSAFPGLQGLVLPGMGGVWEEEVTGHFPATGHLPSPSRHDHPQGTSSATESEVLFHPRELRIKTTLRCHISTREAENKQTDTTTCWQGCGTTTALDVQCDGFGKRWTAPMNQADTHSVSQQVCSSMSPQEKSKRAAT